MGPRPHAGVATARERACPGPTGRERTSADGRRVAVPDRVRVAAGPGADTAGARYARPRAGRGEVGTFVAATRWAMAALAARVAQLSKLSEVLESATRGQGVADAVVAGDDSGDVFLRAVLAQLRWLREGPRVGPAEGQCTAIGAAESPASGWDDGRLLAELRVVGEEARRRRVLHQEAERELRAEREEERECRQDIQRLEAEMASQRIACTSLDAALCGISEETALASAAERRAAARVEALEAECGRETGEVAEVLQELRCAGDEFTEVRREAAEQCRAEEALEAEVRDEEQRLADGEAGARARDAALRGLEQRRAACHEGVANLEAFAARESEESAAVAEDLHAATEEARRAAAERDEAESRWAALLGETASRRAAFDERFDEAESELQDLRRRHAMSAAAQVAEARTEERLFRRALPGVRAEAAAFAEAGESVAEEAEVKEAEVKALHEEVEETRCHVEGLELALSHARVSAASAEERREASRERETQAQAELLESEVEKRLVLGELRHEEGSRARDYIPVGRHEAAEREAEELVAEEQGLAEELGRLEALEEQVSSALSAAQPLLPLRNEISVAEAQCAELAEELSSATQVMDHASHEVQEKKDAEAALREEHAARESSWKRVETEVETRCRRAKAAEAALVREEDDLREELQRLSDASEARDIDFGELLEQVTEFEAARAERGHEEEQSLQELREAGLREAEEAGRKVEALDARLGEELRRRQAELSILGEEAAEASREVASFEEEEAELARAWRTERDRHLQEAASVLAHLQSLGDGPVP